MKMNKFNVGEIVQHKIYSYCSLITNVDTSIREYVVMYIEDDAREATLSFVYCHQQYELALRAE